MSFKKIFTNVCNFLTFGKRDVDTPTYKSLKRTHIMVDIETMDKTPNSAIVSIGAVVFNPATKELGERFIKVVDLNDSAKYGSISADTVLWWLELATKSRPEFLSDEAVPLLDALIELDSFISAQAPRNKILVWGNGADFDNVILQNGYEQLDIPVPWNHWNNQHVRTVVLMGQELLNINPKFTLARPDEAHNALGDAIHQANYVSEIWSDFGDIVTKVKMYEAKESGDRG